MPRDPVRDWAAAQANSTYLANSLDIEAGLGIRWHSPGDPESSQVYCISAFCTLRQLPDCDSILSTLYSEKLSYLHAKGPWSLTPEHTDAGLLGETGLGTPTNVDVYSDCDQAAVCIEAKFIHDAAEGFGSCGQAKNNDGKLACAGYYGSGSDLRTKTAVPCRLTVPEGRRNARKYWELGKPYFLPSVFAEQTKGQDCPFKGPHFQLMRNFLFAATAAKSKKSFGVLAIVPEATSARVRSQVKSFQSKVLKPEYRGHVAVAAYEDLIQLLGRSGSERGKQLGKFLTDKITTMVNYK